MIQWAQRTDVFPIVRRRTVAVGTVTTTVIDSQSLRGYDSAVVFLENKGTDVLNGQIQTSPDGVFPGAVLSDGAFTAMSPGEVRGPLRIDGDAQFFKLLAAFDSAAGDVEVSVILQRNSR
jgi:hypothetical protein